MKPILLLLPMPPGINRSAYVRDCVMDCFRRGEIPLSGNVYEWIGFTSCPEITDDLLHLAQSVVVYNDFDISRDIKFVMFRAEAAGKEVNTRKLTSILDIVDPLESILTEISLTLGLNKEDLRSKRRKRGLAEARFVYFRRAREKCKNISLETIGRKVNKNHATVLYGIRMANEIKEIVAKYNRCYARETPIAYTIMASAGGTGIRSITTTSKGSVVSYGSVEKREKPVPAGEPALRALY